MRKWVFPKRTGQTSALVGCDSVAVPSAEREVEGSSRSHEQGRNSKGKELCYLGSLYDFSVSKLFCASANNFYSQGCKGERNVSCAMNQKALHSNFSVTQARWRTHHLHDNNCSPSDNNNSTGPHLTAVKSCLNSDWITSCYSCPTP